MGKKNARNNISRTLEAAQDALNNLSVSIIEIKKASKIISDSSGDIIVTGIGKSGFIGQKFTASLVSLGRRAFYLHPTEALHGDLGMLSKGDVMIAISFSGKSKEVLGIARYAKKRFGVTVISLCKEKTSPLGKISDCCVEVLVEEEGSPNDIAPMASTTATLVACDMITTAVISKNFKDEDFAVYHPGGALGLSLNKVKDFMKKGKDVPRVKESESFLNAVKEIDNKRLGVTSVVNQFGKLSGVITDGDIRRFILKNKNIREVKIKEMMTSRPKCVQEEDSLQVALSTMERNKITNIFVVGKNNKLIGILHMHDIIEELSP